MRKLTIKRKKHFAGSIMKVKIYIEDAQPSELTIKGFPCKKLGDIKNNSELVVDIDENLHRIFAIIDVYTKDTCVDMIEIPAGNEDVYVSGRNYLSPFKGNPFIFDK